MSSWRLVIATFTRTPLLGRRRERDSSQPRRPCVPLGSGLWLGHSWRPATRSSGARRPAGAFRVTTSEPSRQSPSPFHVYMVGGAGRSFNESHPTRAGATLAQRGPLHGCPDKLRTQPLGPSRSCDGFSVMCLPEVAPRRSHMKAAANPPH
jgi:hypothetical protein